MEDFITLIRENTQWLYTRLFESEYLYLDLWSFVHLWSGMVIFSLFLAFGIKRKWLWLFILLLLYEIVEQGIVILGYHVFYLEKIVDVVNDLITGFVGGLIIDYMVKSPFLRKIRFPVLFFPMLLATATVSYIWVGNYKYVYIISLLNSKGICWWAFIWWFLGGIGVIASYIKLSGVVKGKIRSSVAVWILYLTGLIIFEYIGYSLLQIREVGHIAKPLFLNIIHGTFAMHVFYLIAPFVFILLFELFSVLFTKASQQQK